MSKKTSSADLKTLLLHRLALPTGVLVTVVALDQWTKDLAQEFLRFQMPKIYLGGLFRFQYAENPGAFLSLGANLSDTARFWILTVLVGIALLASLWILVRSTHPALFTWGLSLMLAGGVGNLIDRALYGKVIDFMFMGWKWIRTGIFNVADVAIMVGVGLILIDSFRVRRGDRPARDLSD